MKTSKQTPMEGLINDDGLNIPNRCQGWHRTGGAFTLGPTVWRQCTNRGVVMITFKENKEFKRMPACAECWQLCIDKHLHITKTTPIRKEKHDSKRRSSKRRAERVVQ